MELCCVSLRKKDDCLESYQTSISKQPKNSWWEQLPGQNAFIYAPFNLTGQNHIIKRKAWLLYTVGRRKTVSQLGKPFYNRKHC